jgi:hypothetical protein
MGDRFFRKRLFTQGYMIQKDIAISSKEEKVRQVVVATDRP